MIIQNKQNNIVVPPKHSPIVLLLHYKKTEIHTEIAETILQLTVGVALIQKRFAFTVVLIDQNKIACYWVLAKLQ